MNVTYFLGAGASANAIPVVKEFNKKFFGFLYHLNEFTNDDTEIKIFLRKVRDELPYQYSIDTYARKLFYQNTNYYEAFKTLIAYYFLFEQKPNDEEIEEIGVSDEPEPEPKIIIDNRYDSFFAALINEETKTLSDNIQFISWNYDIQLELSYASFFKEKTIEEAFTDLKSYPCVSTRGETKSIDAKIVKLNGTAGLFYDNSSNNNEYIFCSPPQEKLNNKFWDKCSADIIKSLKKSKAYSSLIEYAWDKKIECKNSRKRAKEIISISDIIIIIGYSFPNYNRAIDRDIFANIMPETKITLQVLKNDFDSYEERLRTILPDTSMKNIAFHDDIMQFYIPNELLT